MQRKHFLLAALICFGLVNIYSAQEYDTINDNSARYKTPENIAFILLKLVNNEIRIEKYNNQEFSLSTNFIDERKSKHHCIATINMREKGLSPLTIEWDEDRTGKININTGRGKNIIYSISLESIFQDTADNIIAICFDCIVKKQRNKEDKTWKSYISVVLPIKVDNTKIEFIFNEKVKAACGFFMSNEDFEDLIELSGSMTKKEALETGLLYIEDQDQSIENEEIATEEQTAEPETADTFVIAVAEPKESSVAEAMEDKPDITETTTERPNATEAATSKPAETEPLTETTTEITHTEEASSDTEAPAETQDDLSAIALATADQKESIFSYVCSSIASSAIYLKDAFVTQMITIRNIFSNLFSSWFGGA